MINIEPIEAFNDNYIWLVTTNEGSIVIDPGESNNLLKILNQRNLDLRAILIFSINVLLEKMALLSTKRRVIRKHLKAHLI